jgi:N-acetylglutamate synthase-like GNAT family acetyltransferase
MNFEYSIRPANDGDLSGLKEVLSRNGQRSTIVIDDRSLYYLAVMDGSTFIGLTGAELSGDSALIRSTAVLAPYRAKGIAGQLVNTLLQDLKRKGIQKLYLFSRDTGAFWEGFGFSRCSVEEVMEAVPDAPQVVAYISDNSIWTDVAWCRYLVSGSRSGLIRKSD